VQAVTDQQGAIRSLAVSDNGSFVAVLTESGNGNAPLHLASFVRSDSSYHYKVGILAEGTPGASWLCPHLWGVNLDRVNVLFWTGAALWVKRGPMLLNVARQEYAAADALPRFALSLPPGDTVPEWLAMLTLDGTTAAFYGTNVEGGPRAWAPLGWGPELVEAGTLKAPSLAWRYRGSSDLELAGVTANGSRLHWSELAFRDGDLVVVASATFSSAGAPLRAVQFVRRGLLAAVTASSVLWLRQERNGFALARVDNLDLSGAVACFWNPLGNALVVVGADGSLTQVPGL
jgi:hypothetical protein